MRPAILLSAVAFSLAAFSALAADPAPAPAPAATDAAPAPDDGTTDAARSSFTEGAPAQDRTVHDMSFSNKEPDLDRKADKAGQQVNVTGVVEARAPDSQIVCKYSPLVGSRISTKLCLPLYRWKELHRDAQQVYLDQATQGTMGTIPKY